jgi:hypothetical protein
VTFDEFMCEGMPNWELCRGDWWYKRWTNNPVLPAGKKFLEREKEAAGADIYAPMLARQEARDKARAGSLEQAKGLALLTAAGIDPAGFGEVYVSPLHMAMIMSAIASGGAMPRPLLVDFFAPW